MFNLSKVAVIKKALSRHFACALVAFGWVGLASIPAQAAEYDLSQPNSFATINGGFFQQFNGGPAGTGFIDSFVRIQQKQQESGYNTDYRPVQFDEKKDLTYTHAVLISDLTAVSINGASYYEFFLDINEPNANAYELLSLDQFVLHSGSTDMLHDYDPVTKTYNSGGTSQLLFDLDAGMDNWIKLSVDPQSGSGHFDMVAIIPQSVIAAATGPYLYLFSQFGTHYNSQGGFEEWTVQAGPQPPGPGPVPLPASVWGGLVLMSLMGVNRLRKRIFAKAS